MRISRKKLFLDIVLMSLLISVILFVNGARRDAKADTNEIYKNVEIFAEVLRQIEENYVEPQEAKKLIYGAIKGMVQSLDPHSSFMTREEHQELLIETKGAFSGIGIEITIRDNILTVVSPIEDTPAYTVGIHAGDQIIKIDDKPANDMSLMDAVKYIRGPKGTKVKLTIKRENIDKPLDFEITRDVIPLKSVRAYLLTPEIGYVRISNFQGNTIDDLTTGLDKIENGRTLKGLVLDLRNNPGGLLSQAIKVSDIFLDSGIIVSTKGRHASQNMEVKAHKNQVERNYPMVILVNGGSASAAEIVAGALQDNKKALILGTKTFGKGSVQTILPLKDGSGLRLTTARYYTPNGNSIQLTGIVPDINLEYIPPTDKTEAAQQKKFLREKDLKGHMPRETTKEGDEGKSEKVNNNKDDKDEKARMLLDRDNQVRHAVQLLQSWNIFSEIKGKP